MHKGLLKHKVQSIQFQSTTGMKDRIDVLDWDMLSTYGQDGLRQLVFVAREMLAEPESVYRFLLGGLIFL